MIATIISIDSVGSDQLIYWSFGVSALTLLWTILWAVWTNRRSSIRNFWFHEVVGPRSVNPLLDFSNRWIGRCKQMSPNQSPAAVAAELNEFGREKDVLLGEVWVCKLLFDDVYKFACDQLDGVEDEFGVAVGKVASIAAGAQITPPDFQDVCRELEVAVLRVLSRLVGARFRV